MDPMDPVEKRVNLDLKDHLGQQVLEECQDQEVTLVLLVLLDFLEPLVLMVSLESRAHQESLVKKETLDLQDHRAWLDLRGLLGLLVWLA